MPKNKKTMLKVVPSSDAKSSLYDDGALTIAEAEKFMSVSRSYLYKLMDEKRLPYSMLGPRGRRIPLKALIRLLEENTIGGQAAGFQAM